MFALLRRGVLAGGPNKVRSKSTRGNATTLNNEPNS
jgi:hypothetical protein